MSILLSIDLGTHLGWALGPMSADATPDDVEWGTLEMKGGTIHAWLRSIEQPMLILLGRATSYAVERPNTGGQNFAAIRKNMFMLGKLHDLAGYQGLTEGPELSPTSAKKAWTGSGLSEKPEMILAAHRRGYPVETEHEADALAIRHLHIFGKLEDDKEAAALRERLGLPSLVKPKPPPKRKAKAAGDLI